MQCVGALGCEDILATGSLGSTALKSLNSFDKVNVIYALSFVLVERESRHWPRTRTHVYLASNITLPSNFSKVT